MQSVRSLMQQKRKAGSVTGKGGCDGRGKGLIQGGEQASRGKGGEGLLVCLISLS